MRISRNETLILSALMGRERYGLEIVERVFEKNGVKLALGGLYTTLHRMERKGLLKGDWGEQVQEAYGARRRYYTITALGQQALRDEKAVLSPAFRFRSAQ